MARKPRRDLTIDEQLARGPLDLPFLMLVVLLTGVGLIMMFSASYASAYYYKSDPFYFAKRQAIFVFGGIPAMYLVSRLNYRHFRYLAPLGIVVAEILLLLVFTPLGRSNYDARRWLRLGPLSFQPSEIAKIAVILYFAARLSRDPAPPKRFSRRTYTGTFLNWLQDIGIMELVPYGTVLLLILVPVVFEPHMSGTILIIIGAAAVLFVGGIPLKWFLMGGGAMGAGLWFIINNTDYMTDRINLWKDPWIDPLDNGYQTIQSLYAIASGGLFGLGLGKSIQKHAYIPEPENDFVFAIVVEELGFVGGVFILILFALLILRGYWLALHARDRFGSLLIVGIITLLAAQVFLNIGVVTNLIPNTGISLPFFSSGGTALLIHLGEMGIVLSVSRQIPAPKND